MTRVANRLPGWQRRLLLTSGVVLLATGVAWLALHYAAASDGLPQPAEAWLLKLHGLAAFAALFLLGALAAHHIPHGWRVGARHRYASQRTTGLALCTLGAFLVASGYALYYFAPEGVRPVLGWAHALAGIVLAGMALYHRRSAAHAPHAHSGTRPRPHSSP